MECDDRPTSVTHKQYCVFSIYFIYFMRYDSKQYIIFHVIGTGREVVINMLILRRAVESDCGRLFYWANDRETRKNSFHTEEISYGEHTAWFQRKLQEPACQIFILLCDGREAGQIRLEQEGDTAKISYVIAPEYRNRGLGSEILRLVEPFAEGKALLGRVKRENRASGKCFEKNGYEKTEQEEWVEYIKMTGK